MVCCCPAVPMPSPQARWAYVSTATHWDPYTCLLWASWLAQGPRRSSRQVIPTHTHIPMQTKTHRHKQTHIQMVLALQRASSSTGTTTTHGSWWGPVMQGLNKLAGRQSNRRCCCCERQPPPLTSLSACGEHIPRQQHPHGRQQGGYRSQQAPTTAHQPTLC